MSKREREIIRRFFAEYCIVSAQIELRNKRVDDLLDERKQVECELEELHERKELLIKEFDKMIFELVMGAGTYDADNFMRIRTIDDY